MIRLALLVLLLWVGPAGAVQPDEPLADAALERRAREISVGLRCLVCQNQSIDDSDAPLARDLRILVRERLQAGDSDADIRGYLVARYGDFVLLRPPFGAATLLLWLTPVIVLVAGGAVALTWARRVAPAGAEALTAEEEERVARMLREQG